MQVIFRAIEDYTQSKPIIALQHPDELKQRRAGHIVHARFSAIYGVRVCVCVESLVKFLASNNSLKVRQHPYREIR